jgi:hypothetical protein
VASRLGAPGGCGLTFVGLIMTGFGLTLRRMARAGLSLCFGVMGVGTALVPVGCMREAGRIEGSGIAQPKLGAAMKLAPSGN